MSFYKSILPVLACISSQVLAGQFETSAGPSVIPQFRCVSKTGATPTVSIEVYKQIGKLSTFYGMQAELHPEAGSVGNLGQTFTEGPQLTQFSQNFTDGTRYVLSITSKSTLNRITGARCMNYTGSYEFADENKRPRVVERLKCTNLEFPERNCPEY